MGGQRVDLSTGTKPCAKCNETKPLEAFGKNKYSANGYTSYCKACQAETARAYRATPQGKEAHKRSTDKWIAGLDVTPDPEGTKTCNRCHINKPFAEYPKNRRTKSGVASYCLPCSAEIVRNIRSTPEGTQAHRAASKRWRENNAERHADNNAKRAYGLERGGYATMLAAQEGKCAICETTNPGSRLNRFHVDHCHSSSVIRGLLCELCNRGLGSFKDSPDLLTRAATYVASAKRGGESG